VPISDVTTTKILVEFLVDQKMANQLSLVFVALNKMHETKQSWHESTPPTKQHLTLQNLQNN